MGRGDDIGGRAFMGELGQDHAQGSCGHGFADQEIHAIDDAGTVNGGLQKRMDVVDVEHALWLVCNGGAFFGEFPVPVGVGARLNVSQAPMVGQIGEASRGAMSPQIVGRGAKHIVDRAEFPGHQMRIPGLTKVHGDVDALLLHVGHTVCKADIEADLRIANAVLSKCGNHECASEAFRKAHAQAAFRRVA